MLIQTSGQTFVMPCPIILNEGFKKSTLLCTSHSYHSVSQSDPFLWIFPSLPLPSLPPSITPSFSLAPSDMDRVGYPDKARLYKHSSVTGRTPSPERGISPQSSHTNAYIHTHRQITGSQYYSGSSLYLSWYSAFIQS